MCHVLGVIASLVAQGHFLTTNVLEFVRMVKGGRDLIFMPSDQTLARILAPQRAVRAELPMIGRMEEV
jgi:hypothetical protein